MSSELLPPPTQLLTDPKTGAVDEAWYRFFELLSASAITDVPASLTFLDEDNMVSDSATAVASQQSIKAYVDTTVAASISGVSVLTSGTQTNQTSLDLALDGYTDFKIFKLSIFNLVPATDGAAPWVRFSDDGGLTFEADVADYDWTFGGSTDAGATTDEGDDTDSQIELCDGIGNAAGEGAGFEITVLNPAGSDMTRVIWSGYRIDGSGNMISLNGAGGMLVAGPSTDVRLIMSAGNLTCNYTLVGIS